MNAPAVPEAVLSTAAGVLARRVGFRLDPSVSGRLSRSVLDDAAAHDMDVSAYVACLDREPSVMQSLLDRVTVQETSFFRDANQFMALREMVLPDLTGPVSIWSAGCSNGQEAFSLAMTLARAGIADGRVTASDISSRALERTRRARYSSREMAGVGPAERSRSFSPVGAEWQVVGPLKDRVEVVHHNLAADPPPLAAGVCDIVFCRNVLIYFRPEHVAAFIHRLASWMRPGGWLFLGYSESLWQVSDAFQLTRLGDAFAYRRRGHGHPPAAAPRTRSGAARPASVVRAKRPAVEIALGPTATGSERAIVELSAIGESAMKAGDNLGAVAAFRKRTYLDPDQPVAYLHLGLALEAAGDPTSARRAYRAARRALSMTGKAKVEAALDGYEVSELRRLLDAKLQVAS